MAENSEVCFHCGEVCPAENPIIVKRQGMDLPMCCNGCRAVSELIFSTGLDRYYQFRDGQGRRAEEDIAALGAAWKSCDAREALWGEPADDGYFDLLLQTEGVHCAACAWLIRNRLEPQPGIKRVQVDISTGYTRLLWDPRQTTLSFIAQELARIGYRPHLPLGDEEERGRLQERRNALLRVGVAGLGMMQVMMYAVGLYAGDAVGITAGAERFLEWTSLLVTIPVVLYSGRPFFTNALQGLRRGRVPMDVPVALAIAAAFVASSINFLRGQGEVYFDSVVMFVFFLSAARYIQLAQRHRNLQSGSALARLLPEWAQRIRDGALETVLLQDLQPGDQVRVRGGEPVPADGVVFSGCTDMDESLLTGESQRVPRQPGDKVVGGSVNLGTAIDVTVTETGSGSTVAALGRMLLRARSHSTPGADRAEAIAGHFVLVVLLMALLTGGYWLSVDPLQALPAVLAVLVVSCPCALSLATPAALSAASRRLLQEGVFLTNADALLALSRVDTVVFDKTGTLTLGRPRRTAMHRNPNHPGGDRWTDDQLIHVAAAMEAHSSHPLARAFADVPEQWAADEVDSAQRQGLRGTVRGHQWCLGSSGFVGVGEGEQTAVREGARGGIWLADDAGWLAVFELSDNLRPGSRPVIEALQADGMELHILSGDHPRHVGETAQTLNINSWSARQSPAMKMARIEEWQRAGAVVAMVGDGVNDAPVLARADVSLTVQGASELANSAADLILNGESLLLLERAREISHRTVAIIRQNMRWAIGYNILAMPLAMAGLLEPWMAALGMSASSLLVVANSTRIGRGKVEPSRVEPEASVAPL